MNFSAKLKIHNVFHVVKLHKHKEMNEMKSDIHQSVKNVFENDYKYVMKKLINLKKRD